MTSKITELPTLVPVGPADLQALTQLVRAYYSYDQHHFDEPVILAALRQLCEGTAYARCFFIHLGETRIGYVSASFGFSIEVGGFDFFLDEFFIEEPWRGRGLGRVLLAMIEDEVRKLGGRRLCLEAVLYNPRAAYLYATSGYKEHERRLLSKVL
ncbi:MAG TPA: GNAT family N-acetyltransferase [Kiloniellales bacterium]|nr:GNAT family N-acetyltransferase [Kiloniellales bacterium]